MRRGPLFFLLGVLLNLAIQYVNYRAALADWVGSSGLVKGGFLHQLSWLMLLMSGAFFGLIGALLQRRADERTLAAELEAYAKAKGPAKPGLFKD